MQLPILKPILKKHKNNLTAGIFSPSHPAHILFSEKYELGIANLKKLGFNVREGSLTKNMTSEGYRTANAELRAKEIMDLICDDEVDLLISNIGGSNTSSLLPFLDYSVIRKKRKLIVGYSDVTSLQMAVLTKAGLSTCYGPAITPSFGEWPEPDETASFFKDLLSGKTGRILAPKVWSNTFRDYNNGSWCRDERIYKNNEGWKVICPGEAKANLVIVNLSTLLSIAGTEFFPDLKGKILLIEDADASVSMFERRINQLKLIGVLKDLKAIIFSKLEFHDSNYGYDRYETVLREFCGEFGYPIVSNFDCGHTTPIISFCQNASIHLKVGDGVNLEVIEKQVSWE